MNVLPNEIIINNIEPFTRNIQKKDLLNDIVHYHRSMEFMMSKILQFILNYISDYVVQDTINEQHIFFIRGFTWYYWEIDLLEYLNGNQMLFTVLSRFVFSSPKCILNQIQKYKNYLNLQINYDEYNKDICNFRKCKYRIRLLWSNMTSKERNEYISSHYI